MNHILQTERKRNLLQAIEFSQQSDNVKPPVNNFYLHFFILPVLSL